MSQVKQILRIGKLKKNDDEKNSAYNDVIFFFGVGNVYSQPADERKNPLAGKQQCKVSSDCTLVSTECSACQCQQPINKEFAEEYNKAHLEDCKEDKGSICKDSCATQYTRCEKYKCILTDLPILECEVKSAAGNFNSYLRPMPGDTLRLDLNTVEEIREDKYAYSLRFNDQKPQDTYIPISSSFSLTAFPDEIGDRFYMRLKAKLSTGDITIDIHPVQSYNYQMFMVYETDFIYGVAFLICTQVEK